MKQILIYILLVGCVACANLAPSQAPSVRLHEVHPFGATVLAFSADGSLLATGGFQGEIMVWRMPDGEPVATFKHHSKPVRGIAWLNSTTLISAAEDGRLLRWSLPDGEITYERNGEPVTALALDASSRQVLVGHRDGELELLDAERLTPVAARNLGRRVLSVTMSNDGQTFAVSTAGSQVRIFAHALASMRELPPPPRNANDLRLSPDGNHLWAGGWFQLYRWDLATAKLAVRETEHPGAVISLDPSPDGKHLVSIGRHTDSSVRVTDIASGAVMRRLAAHPLCGWNVRYSPDGRYVASSSEDGSVHLYDVTIPYTPSFVQSRPVSFRAEEY